MSLSEPYFHQEERSQSPPDLAINASRLQALVQDCADVFWMLTPTGEMREVSSSWQVFTGQQERDCLGRGWFDAFHPMDQQQGVDALDQSVTSHQTQELTCHIRGNHGEYRQVRLRFVPVHTFSVAINEVLVWGVDLTKQDQSEQMSEAQVKLALKASRVGMWDWDLITDQLMWTKQTKALFGLPPDTPISYERFLKAVHPNDRERVHQRNMRAIVEKQEYSKDYRTIWPDGSTHWLSDRAQSITDASGKVVHIVGATLDITELKQTEEQLQEAHQKIATILESITDSFVHVDAEWRYTYVNRWMESFLGKSREELIGQCLWDVAPGLLGTPFEHFYRRAMATQIPLHFETLHPTSQRWVDVHVYPTRNGLSIYMQDITERKQMECALRESEALLHRFMESNIIGMIVTDADPEGNVYEANDAFLSLIGYTREDLAEGRIRWGTITAPEVQVRDAQALKETLRTGVAQPYEKEYVTKDGKRVPVLIGRALYRREGSTPLLICFVLDLTAAKELERQKDLFLGITGHELKTPLAALRGMLQLVQRRFKRALSSADMDHMSPEIGIFFDSLKKSLADSIRQIDVQTRLINDLLDVSRITSNTLTLSLDRWDLVALVRETIEDLRVTVPERSLLLELPEQSTVNVWADRNRISQVVMNYVTNALRYSPSDQPVFIGLVIEKDVARVWVRDQGPGLSQEDQKDIWQRFHQVKSVPVQGESGSEKGLGLGLYICRTLIEQHHGEVGVESTPGKGSTFWFTLPRVS